MSRKSDKDAGFSEALIPVVVFFVALVLAAGVWGLKVLLSDPIGKGNAIVKVNNSDNRLSQQAYFEQTFADIQAADDNLDVPGNPTEISGRTIYCRRLVADYNAAARKEVAAKFRAADLPYQIDSSDPATDCKKDVN